MAKPLSSVDAARAALTATGYLPSKSIETVAYLAAALDRPILVEGPAGVGKTAFAQALATATERPLIRLQCYEGLDDSKALYEWEYSKQLLYTQVLKDRFSALLADANTPAAAADKIAELDAIFFSRRFLLQRPVLQALLSPTPALLLIDEIDKADPEFEALLLEVLAERAVTIPELGTLSAVTVPIVVLTSNNARELSDALKRRCLHLFIDYPDRDQELAILRSRVPGLSDELRANVVHALHALRQLDLKKPPSVAEAIEWGKALVLVGASALSRDVVASTLSLILKHERDVQRATETFATWAAPPAKPV